ncbi:MAG: M14 family zinc carboxypeptidase [Planctomycetota bacterium]
MPRSIRSLAGLTPAIVLAALAALASTPAAAITIEAGFDHGSLESWNVSGGGGRGGSTVNLVGRDNFYGGGQWRWMYFQASDVINTRPLFSTSNNFAGGSARLDNHVMVYSYDQENWEYFDNASNGSSGGTYTFSNNTNFTQDDVWIAYAFPYSYADSVAHTQQVLATPWAVPTSSGDANGVIGQSPGGVDDLGRNIAPRDIYGYRITDTSTDGQLTKNKVVIMTGMHAGETLGTHNYAGLVDWLVSGDPLAVEMLKTTEFFAYPTSNPDGRFAGYNRSTVQNPNQDPNGRWSSATWAAVPDIEVNGEAMLADVAATPGGLAVDYFVDFHSTIPTNLNDDFGFIEVDQGDDQSAFWQALLDLQPNIGQIDSTSTGPTSANFADWELNAEVDVTFETQFGLTRPLQYYYDLGENFGRAFAEGFGITIAGDFDDDGDVDVDDVDLLFANLGNPDFDLTGNGVTNTADVNEMIQNILETAFGDANLDQKVDTSDLAILAGNFSQSVSSWAQADFNGDGVVNTADLAQLAGSFGFDGTGALTANAALVPEPGTIALLGVGAAFVARRRSKR